jgi:hypothetical protein
MRRSLRLRSAIPIARKPNKSINQVCGSGTAGTVVSASAVTVNSRSWPLSSSKEELNGTVPSKPLVTSDAPLNNNLRLCSPILTRQVRRGRNGSKADARSRRPSRPCGARFDLGFCDLPMRTSAAFVPGDVLARCVVRVDKRKAILDLYANQL